MGRPPKYETSEELESKINDYFDQEGLLITISGLCLYLGFCSRQSFYDLAKDKKFSYTIKTARLRIEEYYEKAMMDRNKATGAIFALKNFGWSDKGEEEGGETGNVLKIEIVNAERKNP